jgi:transcriptional regulator with XRE-family HTH domain
MDFKKARERAGLTLEKASEVSGYGIGTISGLENHDAGSTRLRQKLREIYGISEVRAAFEGADADTRIAEASDDPAAFVYEKSSLLRLAESRAREAADDLRKEARKLMEIADRLDPDRSQGQLQSQSQSQIQTETKYGRKKP